MLVLQVRRRIHFIVVIGVAGGTGVISVFGGHGLGGGSVSTLNMLYILINVHTLRPLNIHKEFLRVRSDLRARARFYVLLDFFPIFPENI